MAEQGGQPTPGPERRYRVAVVGGAGTWGRYYLRTYANHPDCEIVAIVDRAGERARGFADHYGIPKVYDTVQDLLAVEIPDIVSACVPVAHNSEVVTACADAGVRVVSCEKPIAAELAEADAMVRVCRERGTLFACGQAAWAPLPDIARWVGEGNIGRLTAAAIPGGLPTELSGGGCVQLATLRLLTGMEVEWVEGWVLPSEPGYVAPPGRPESEADCPAYGRLGLSGGIVCEILEPTPDRGSACVASATGENGQVWAVLSGCVLVQGTGPMSTPVYPDFLNDPPGFFESNMQRLLDAFDTGQEPPSSGHDYRQSLEIGIALKLSAQNGHERVHLPLEDRSLRLYPHPYRLTGGDVAGWESIGYAGPPQVPFPASSLVSFDDLARFSDHQIQVTMREVELRDLVLALLNAEAPVTDKILGSMSERVRGFIEEEMDAAKSTPAEEIAEARERILEIARRQ